jgi:hypothetical protein
MNQAPVAHTCILDVQEAEIRIKASPGKQRDPILKKPIKKKRAGGVAQVVECLPRKHVTLSSSSNTKRMWINEDPNTLLMGMQSLVECMVQNY